jgi:hypothetical protein
MFDIASDGYSDLFELRPIDEETLRLAVEDWAIWLRWEEAFHAGRVDLSTHPALPDERPRHEQLKALITPRLEGLTVPVSRATAEFRPVPGHADMGRGRWMQVWWTVVDG